MGVSIHAWDPDLHELIALLDCYRLNEEWQPQDTNVYQKLKIASHLECLHW